MEEDKKTTINQNAQAAFGVPVKTVLLIVLLALVAGLLVYVALNPKKNAPAPSIKKEVVNPADTMLSIEPAVAQSEANTYSSEVSIDTGKNTVAGVQLELVFDPSILTNVVVSAGSFFSTPVELLKKVDQKTGRISYAIALAPGASGLKGKGVVAKITYFVVGTTGTTTSIKFTGKTQVSGEGTISSLLKSANDGVVDLASPTITAPSATSQ